MADMLTFKDLQDRMIRWLDDTSMPTYQLAKDAINASHRRLLTSYRWPFMRWPRRESFTTTQGVVDYTLKVGMGAPIDIWDMQLKKNVPVIPTREFEAEQIDLSAPLQVPDGIMFGSMWPVSAQPVVASTLSLVSTAGDLSTVLVRGLDATGNLTEELVTMNGTTPVMTANTYLHLTNLSKSTVPWQGTLTVSAGSTTLVTLGATTPSNLWPTIRFSQPPFGNLNYTFTGYRLPRTLVNDGDIPETPFPYSEFHVYDALLDYATYNTELGQKEMDLWKDRAKDLKDGLYQRFDEAIAGSRPRFVRDVNGSGRRVNVLPLT